MFLDLLNDALKQAKNELEKTVDTALGIGGPAAPAPPQQPGHDDVEKPAVPEGAVQPAKKGKKASTRKPKADSGFSASAVSIAHGPQPDSSSITGSAMQKENTPHVDNGCGTDPALVQAGDMCQQDQEKTILAAGTSSSSNMHVPSALGDPAAQGLHAHHHSHHPADTEAGQHATAPLQPSEAPAQPAIPSTATAQHEPPGQGDTQQAPNPVLEDPAPGPQGPSEAPPGPPQGTLLGPPGPPQGPVAPSQGHPPGPEDVRSGSMGRVALPPDISSLDHEQLVGLVHRLHADMGVREAQLLRQAQQMSQNQQVMAQLQDKAEVAALKSAKVSEADLEDMRKECEQRLGAAERKVYALTKERDALKRGNEKLADYTSLIREKDGIIKQVMEEGEKLSSRVSELEALLKKTRGQAKDFEMERDQLASRLAAEEAVSEGLRRAKAKAERDLAALQESVRQELEASRQQVELALQRGRAEQAEQDERMHEATHAALTRKLRDAEARCEALGESVMELRDALERQRQAADLREEMLQQDLADLERRCQAAELRHQELTAKLPEATRPLLRQIEAMQTAAEAQSDAWAAAEHTLVSRINEAEARAATAVERERGSLERCQVLQARLAGLEAALASSRADLTSLRSELETAEQLTRSLQQQLGEARQAAELATQRYNLLGQQLEQAESRHAQALAAARQSAESAATSLRKEVQVLEARLAQAAQNGRSGQEGAEEPGAWPAQSHAEGMSRGGMEPPAMAAPGYRWVPMLGRIVKT
ncbi:TMF_TATA_bd domain-containing protein [Haematococcus lacustris]|uniref:TMF_TATA_bd domain-containing protein n=1 Tax=Haematococcus lacustris TaxID=44745 RepID=A0A6A0A390_HAELA|nr:TMF_TATA_bd domain-containing protein [Haematococcus lacustris]